MKDEMNIGRSAAFERNTQLEEVLKEINTAILPIAGAPYSAPKHPVIFIVGAPRSGTTLMSQWLSALGPFGYPSNLIARFYANPYFGARIQQALFTFDPHGQIAGGHDAQEFTSDLGRTMGATAPSEFWYYWRQFFKFGDIQHLSDEALGEVDVDSFLKGLAGLEAALSLPLVMKAMNLNWNLSFLNQIMPNVLFINVVRDPFLNAQSLLFARERFFDDRSRWYSFKPPEYETLKLQSPIEQVVGQIYHTRRAVTEGLADIRDERKLTVSYEDFCADPAGVYKSVRNRLQAQGYVLDAPYKGDTAFSVKTSVKLAASEVDEMKAAVAQYDF